MLAILCAIIVLISGICILAAKDDSGVVENKDWKNTYFDTTQVRGTSVTLSYKGDMLYYYMDGFIFISEKMNNEYSAPTVYQTVEAPDESWKVRVSGDNSTIVYTNSRFNNSCDTIITQNLNAEPKTFNGSAHDFHLGSSISVSKDGNAVGIGVERYDDSEHAINSGKAMVQTLNQGKLGHKIYGQSPHF